MADQHELDDERLYDEFRRQAQLMREETAAKAVKPVSTSGDQVEGKAAADETLTVNRSVKVEGLTAGENGIPETPARCSECGHQSHPPGQCLNIASDNDCNCGEVVERPSMRAARRLARRVVQISRRRMIQATVKKIEVEFAAIIEEEMNHG
jgi:hypothetical protein